ncbi:MAG: hypothetical protein IIA17_02095 [candidate division Zixibacteria bacterium]|nr:hypothetical protein [candidate division Zixibacteria bacterium]
MTFEPSILFWVAVLLSLFSAVLAVRLENAVRAVGALIVLFLSVIIVLLSQGAVGLGLVAFLLLGPVIVSFLVIALVSRKISQPIRFTLSSNSRVYLFAAAIFFLINLYLVANTSVWKYAGDINILTLDKALEIIAETYYLPILSLLSFVLLTAVWAVSLKRKEIF